MSLAPDRLTGQASLVLHNVTVRLPTRAGGRALIENVSIDVAPGQIVGLIGPNGAGKSTTLRTIYRATRPTAGAVILDGVDMWSQDAQWCARRVGAVLQEMPAEFPLTVTDIVAMGRTPHKTALASETPHDIALIDAALELMQLVSFRDRWFSSLSGGERQRVLLARALVQQPRLMVLDEPTNHLDLRHQVEMLTLMRDVGVTVIAALHDLTLAGMFCDHLVMMAGGKVVISGPPDAVLTSSRIDSVWGLPVNITPHPTRGTPMVVPA